MKTLLLLFLPMVLFAQYWGERPNEKSFEESSLYFHSYYLNPFGMYQFSEVSPGLIDNPFLRTHLNPAYIPSDSVAANQIYLDFRGDRSDLELGRYYPITPYYDYASSVYYRPDPRWYTVTRSEPEPLFSVGLNKQLSENLYFSGSYQFIFKEEGYYETPTGIYNSRYGMDENGAGLTDNGAVPITDRSAGEDEMHTHGHFWSANLAYRLSDWIRLGINVNAIVHERRGAYANLHADRYSEAQTDDWFNQYSKERTNKYRHLDLGAGVRVNVSAALTAGVKLSYLEGRAEQSFIKKDSSVYYYKWNNGSNYSNHSSFRYGATNQSWDHKGHTASGLVQLDYRLAPTRSLHFYYQYTKRDINLENNSSIRDTSYYAGSYQSSGYNSYYNSWYRMEDTRSASGSSEMKGWQAMLGFRWLETKSSRVNFGVFFSDKYFTKQTGEPVLAENRSYYYRDYTNSDGNNTSTRSSLLYEDKRLEWITRTQKQTLQIPVMLEFDFKENYTLMLAVNRIWNYWKIEEKTTAYFKERIEKKNGDDVARITTNFGERWTEPKRIISEDEIAFLSGLSINISPKFKIIVTASPSFEPVLHMAQWQLGFRAGL